MSLTIFDSRDPAGRAAAELGVMSLALGNLITDCMEAGSQAVAAGRERRAAYEYACELEAARARADDLGRIATRAVKHVAVLEAEVRRLRTALQQRQAHIDRMRGQR